MLLENNLKFKTFRSYDISSISQRLSELGPDVWNLDRYRQGGRSPHLQTKSIIIFDFIFDHSDNGLGFEERTLRKKPDIHFSDNLLNSLTFDIVKELEKEFNGVHGKIIYAKLPSGAEIQKHYDPGYYMSIVHRLHIPILTNNQVNFTVDNETMHMEPGILYEISNTLMHSVKNLGDSDRIHLMIDIIPHDKVLEIKNNDIYI